MKKTKNLMGVGIVFLGCGITFLGVGLATRLTPMWTIAPAFMALGIVFLATSRARGGHGGAESSEE